MHREHMSAVCRTLHYMLAATCAWCAAAGRSPRVLSDCGFLFRLSAHAVCSAVLLHLLMVFRGMCWHLTLADYQPHLKCRERQCCN